MPVMCIIQNLTIAYISNLDFSQIDVMTIQHTPTLCLCEIIFLQLLIGAVSFLLFSRMINFILIIFSFDVTAAERHKMRSRRHLPPKVVASEWITKNRDPPYFEIRKNDVVGKFC